MDKESLFLYRIFSGDGKSNETLSELSSLIALISSGETLLDEEKEEKRKIYYRCIRSLIREGQQHGLSGNLWQGLITIALIRDENAYSLAAERRGEPEGSVNDLALHDFAVIREFFCFDLGRLSDELSADSVDVLTNYHSADENGLVFNRRIRDRIEKLSMELSKAKDVKQFKKAVTTFYAQYGVGAIGLHKAFRITREKEGELSICPIMRIQHVQLSDLVGYEDAKQKLIDNTEAFVKGLPANNCILYGDAGTGKSSSIKAIANRYFEEGLRLIEIYKHQFQDINELIGILKDRNYRFILYMDDLSFEEFEIEYKYLKAVIEGGLMQKPENVLIYATSNRRHLIRERFTDRSEQDDDIHRNATVQEKLSLVARFGVSIYFGAPEMEEYEQIVLALAKKEGIKMPEEELLLEAKRWELSHGGLSGRTATQFVTSLLSSGKYGKNREAGS